MKKQVCENCKWFKGATILSDFPIIICSKSKEVKMLYPKFFPYAWEKYFCGEFKKKSNEK